MKKFTNLFFLGLLTIIFTASCNNQPTVEFADVDLDSEHTSITRDAQAASMQVNFNGQMITLAASDIVATAQKMSGEDADAQAIMSINQSLMSADKEAQLLDVKFTMSDEPVETGMFIFGIETANGKNLTLEMFDEEGFAMVANNKFEITEGNNYKALNVKSLENGTYNFRLKDDAGKELNKQVTVATK